jgi:hypothetical protein
MLDEAKSLQELRQELKQRLGREISVNEVAAEIHKILKELPKGQKREKVALTLAHGLNRNWPSPNRRDLCLLIDRRPAKLAALLEECEWDFFRELARELARQPKSKSRRSRPLTEDERSKNRKVNKNMYEKRKRGGWRRVRPGFIQEQFGLKSSAIPLAPSGPCLDSP